MVEEGVTYPRMFELAELAEEVEGREMQRLAVAVNAAMAKDPQKAVRKLAPDHRRPIRAEDVPPWLRPVRRRSHG